MLLGLRLPPLVGRDHEQHEPDRTDAGEHVADESLVPRDVDEADLAPGREHAPRVAEVDREPAALLLGPAVGVDAGQPDDQRRLAVVDVAGRRDDPERSLGAASVLVDVVTLEGVLDRAREIGELVAETVRTSNSAASGSMRQNTDGLPARSRAVNTAGSAVFTATPHDGIVVPGIDPPPTTDWHLRTCAPSRSPSSDSAQPVRPFRQVVQRLQEHPTDRQLVLATGRVHRQDGLQRGDLHLVHPHGAGDRMRRSLPMTSTRPTTIPACGPPSSLSPEHVTRSAPSARASATDGSSGGMPS